MIKVRDVWYEHLMGDLVSRYASVENAFLLHAGVSFDFSVTLHGEAPPPTVGVLLL